MTNGKRHTNSPTERLSHHLLELIQGNPGIATLALLTQYIDRRGYIRDGYGRPIHDPKKAQARLRTVLSDMRTKGKIWDRQGANNAQYWYASDYRQGPRLQPTLGPPSKPPAPTPATVPPPAPAFLTAHPPATPSAANALTEHLMQTLQHSLQNEETHTGFVPQDPRDHLDDLAHRYRSPTIRLQIQINPDTLDTLLQLLHQLSCVMSDDIADYLLTLSETLHNAEEIV